MRIWANIWLPIPNSFKVVSPRLQAFDGDMVATLLDREIAGWDKNLVRGNFLPNEVESILSIPTSYNFPDDALVWAWTQNGRFTVRSAYKVACNWPLEERSKTGGGEESNPKKRSEF